MPRTYQSSKISFFSLGLIISLFFLSCQSSYDGKSLIWQEVCWPIEDGDQVIKGELGLPLYEPYKMIGQTHVPFTRLIRSKSNDVFIGICYTRKMKELISDQILDSLQDSRKTQMDGKLIAEFLITKNTVEYYRIFYPTQDETILVFTILSRDGINKASDQYNDTNYLSDKFICKP